MRNSIVIFLIVLPFLSLIAQADKNHDYMHGGMASFYTPISYHKSDSASVLTLTHLNAKKETEAKYIQKFSPEGKRLICMVTDKKGNQKSYIEYFYSSSGEVSGRLEFHNGKLKVEEIITFSEDSLFKSNVRYKSGGKLLSKSDWKLDKEGKTLESNKFNHKGDKVKWHWVHSYYEDGSRKSTDVFNKKGKKEKTWSYECKQEGEQLVEKENTVQVCKYDESQIGYLIETTEHFNDKGEIMRQITKFNEKDTSIVEFKSYNFKGKLKTQRNWNYDEDMNLIEFVIDWNGKELGRYTYAYEDGKIVNSKRFYRKKLRTNDQFIYDQSGRLIQLDRFKKNGELGSSFLVKEEYK